MTLYLVVNEERRHTKCESKYYYGIKYFWLFLMLSIHYFINKMVHLKVGDTSLAITFSIAYCQNEKIKREVPADCQIYNENSTKSRRITEMASCLKSKVLIQHTYFH